MIDTCQAASMYEKFYSPNILAVASSLVGEDSLSVNLVIFMNFISFDLFCPKFFFKFLFQFFFFQSIYMLISKASC